MAARPIRVVLGVTRGQPELFADLDSVPPRDRAERIRTLAAIGLVASREGPRLPSMAGSMPPVQSVKIEEAASEKAASFARGIGGI